MNRFAAELVDNDMWFELCLRNENDIVDGVGCGNDAYINMTRELTRATQLNENTTQEELDEAIKIFAPRALENIDARKQVSKNFSADWLFTPYMTLFFRTTDDIYRSRIRETKFGFYEETIINKLDDQERDEIKFKFGELAYKLSQNF